MRSYSPNLKPEQLRNHADAAERLGVPRGNILDLRDAAAELASTNITPVAQSSAVQSDKAQLDKISKKTWWQQHKDRRLARSMAAEKKAAQTALATFNATPVAVVPSAPVVPETLPTPAAPLEPALSTEPAMAEPIEVAAPEVSAAVIETPAPVSPPEQVEAAPIPEAAKLYRRSVRSSQSWRHRVRQWQWRPVLGFVCISLCCIAPVTALALYHQVNSTRSSVEAASRTATQQLSQAAQYSSEFQFNDAATAFDSAATDFRSARDQLTSVNAVLTPLMHALPSKGNQFTSAENILIAGEQLAAAGTDIARAFALLDQAAGATDQAGIAGNTTDILVTAHSAFRPALPRLERAAIALQDIDIATVPAEYQEGIALAQKTVPVIAKNMTDLLSLSETLLLILGHDEPKRYLVLFQNNRELRATGGFIGSFAAVDIAQGQVQTLDIPGGGSYDLAGNLSVNVVSPQPLHLVNTRWQLQDANWWPDFPTSAEKVQWFYRKSGGATVDGVITLTPDIIEQMLKLTGPIVLPDYDVTVDAENFYDITQAQAERKYDDTRESKKFIADLTPELLNRLFALDAANFLPVLQIIYTGLSQKDILLYFNDPFLENELSERGWTGEVKQTAKDYLQVVDTNIAGGKTDAVITETIEHSAVIQPDGAVVDTVTVSRTHHGSVDDAFANVNNLDYMRVYVPAGSQLLSATGFTQPDPKLFLEPAADATIDTDLQTISGDVLIDEQTQTRINQEFGKTVFGNWVETRPGETSRVTITYRLPFTLQPADIFQPTDYYSLLVQKQPGSFDPLLLTQLSYPANYTAHWSYPNPTAQLNQALTRDAFTAVVLEKN